MLRRTILSALLVLAVQPAGPAIAASARVEALIARMTVEEKAGQLNFETADWSQDRGLYMTPETEDRLRRGLVGGLFNIHARDVARRAQEIAVHETRLGIPVLLGYDVVHGYDTIFPMPIGQAGAFDLGAVERSERIAAIEAIGDGVNMTFSPMLDTSRDPRWGRTAEGAGESPWWTTEIGRARVRGFQTDDPRDPTGIAACPKHLGANGASKGGLDYTAAEINERELREVHLPPFRALVDRALCFMAAFNTYDSVPVAANPFILRRILREEWGSDAMVMSDFGALSELERHGVAETDAEAAEAGVRGGLQMDMASTFYLAELPGLVRTGRLPETVLDEAVRAVLTLKERMGLLDDAFARFSASDGRTATSPPDHRAAAQDFAERSLVLLKNDGDVLPFAPSVRTVAVIGPHADAKFEMLGSWFGRGVFSRPVSLAAGLVDVLGAGVEIRVVPIAAFEAATAEETAAALTAARGADAVILAIGEAAGMSGEAASRTEIDLPGRQIELVHAVLAVGRPTAAVVFGGRPLAMEALAAEAPAIVKAWFPGTMGGTAIARMLFGAVEPLARMPVSTPRAVGQIPVHHDRLPSGRPAIKWPDIYSSNYLDRPTTPLFPFGHGLTWTRFAFGEPVADSRRLTDDAPVSVTVPVRNVGDRAGTAMVQLYLRNRYAPISRPVMMFRGFERIRLAPGETGTVRFQVTAQQIAWWQGGDRFAAAPGPIDVMTGPSAGDVATIRIDYAP
jgi:beta-glucosidase